jgi:hypothetical protein
VKQGSTLTTDAMTDQREPSLHSRATLDSHHASRYTRRTSTLEKTMWNGPVGREIRRTTRNMLIVNAILLLLVFVAAFKEMGQLQDVILGPRKITMKSLEALTPDKDKGRRVEVTVDQAEKTGIRHVIVDGSKRTPDAEYLMTHLGGKNLIIQVPLEKTDLKTFAGKPVPVPPKLLSALLGDAPEVPRFGKKTSTEETSAAPKSSVMPWMLDATKTSRPGYMWIAVLTLLGLFCLWNLMRAILRLANPASHPIAKTFAAQGPLEMVVPKVDAEMGQPLQLKSLLVSPSWILTRKMFSATFSPSSDLIWHHGKVTKHYTNGIPTGTTYALMLHLRNGESIEVALNKAKLDEAGELMGRTAPWAFRGHDDEVERFWRNPATRNQLVTAVDERRKGNK